MRAGANKKDESGTTKGEGEKKSLEGWGGERWRRWTFGGAFERTSQAKWKPSDGTACPSWDVLASSFDDADGRGRQTPSSSSLCCARSILNAKK